MKRIICSWEIEIFKINYQAKKQIITLHGLTHQDKCVASWATFHILPHSAAIASQQAVKLTPLFSQEVLTGQCDLVVSLGHQCIQLFVTP